MCDKSDLFDSDLEGLTEEEVLAKIEAEMQEAALTKMEKYRRDNPSLNDAWEQIKTIRALTEPAPKTGEKRPKWERAYFDVVDGIDGGASQNEALKEAWNKYYMMKKLICIEKDE